MVNLPKREKILLYILALLILVVGGWAGVIIPLQKQAMASRARLQNAQAQQEEIETMLSALEGAQDRLAAEEQRKAQESYFYHGIQDVFIDRTLTALASSEGLSVVELQIQDPVLAAPKAFQPFTYSMAAQPQPADTSQGENDAGPTAPLFLCKLTVRGKEAGCVGLIDGVNGLGKSVYVSDFSMEKEDDGLFRAEITVYFYFLEE